MVLSNNHTTPHQTTDVASAVLLLKCPVCNKLPRDNHVDPVSDIVHEHDSSQKFKFKVSLRFMLTERLTGCFKSSFRL